MAKFRVAGNTVINIDDFTGGARNLSSYIDTITPGLGKQQAVLDVTAFADSAERFIAGIEESQSWTVQGHFDDTASTGPDAVLAPLVGTSGTTQFNPVGTASGARQFQCEAICTFYRITGAVKERVSFEAGFQQDGTMTVGTN